jgi:Mg2+ and Co2+ transporter CorA
MLYRPNAHIQQGHIIARCIREFGKEIIDDHGRRIPPTLDLFERRVVSLLSEVKRYIKETNRNAIDYNSEANFLHVLSDCRSELAMIRHILDQQEDILVRVLDHRNQAGPTSPPRSTRNSNDKEVSGCEQLETLRHEWNWGPVEVAHQMLKQYQKRITKIDGDAERIEKNVQDLLNLKRTYASVQDSHAGVLLSVAAIGFAIVTVIFAPLAFLVGLFALNLQGFDRLRVRQEHGQEGSDMSTATGVSDGRDFSANIRSNDGPVFDSGKMAGIFSELSLIHLPTSEGYMTLIPRSWH